MRDARTGDSEAIRCRGLSDSVQRLCGGLLLLEAAALCALASQLAWAIVAWLLAAVWLAWAAVQVQNFRLVGCGRQAVRFALAPVLVNRPGIRVRLAFHIVINWSAIAVTLIAAATAEGAPSRALATLGSLAAAAVWIGFNVLHRRMNRLRNLLLSTAFAALMAAAGVWLLSRG